MAIKNLEDLKVNISRSTILIFIIIFLVSICSLYFVHSKIIKKKIFFNQKEIIYAQEFFKINLSAKLSIIANSTIFLDFIKSGEETRKRLYPQFLPQIISIPEKSILGMKITNLQEEVIFSYGKDSPIYISLNLCYSNQTLDPAMGDCNYFWHIYFDGERLIDSILSMNHGVKTCSDCKYIDVLKGKNFGSFPVNATSGYKMKLDMDMEKDYFFYIYFILMLIAFILFGLWSWLRLSKIINEYIAIPINFLTNCLKTDDEVELKNNIEEIRYLVSEINGWKEKLKMSQANENALKLGKIAAQLAHDVRSPLLTMDMIINQIEHVPEKQNSLLKNAMKRISNIVNDFLTQYKDPSLLNKSYIFPQNISSLLKEMVLEKKGEYANSQAELEYLVNNNAENSMCSVDADNFKRVISNLINNAFESIKEKGRIFLILEKNDMSLRIEITDEGCGIHPDLLPVISKGGVTVGKREGSGFGLSHAINNINEWNGTFNIESRLGLGTKIIIKLPLFDFKNSV